MTRPVLNLDEVEFRDSGHGSGRPPSGDPRAARLAYIGRKENSLDYWDGEGT